MKNQNVNVNALVLATYLSQQGFLLHDTCTCIDQTRIPSNLVLHYFLVNVGKCSRTDIPLVAALDPPLCRFFKVVQ